MANNWTRHLSSRWFNVGHRSLRSLHGELRWLDELLLPPHCHGCHTPLSNSSAHLCADCTAAALQQAISCCPCCSEPYLIASSHHHLCGQCLKAPPPFTWLKTAGLYCNQLAELVQQFKYHNHPSLVTALSDLMLHALGDEIYTFAPTLIIPVPLHPQRLKERGFNQALLLARKLSRDLNVPTDTESLQRRRYTTTQSQLTASQRRRNISGAFHCSNQKQSQRILLVDDVVTTTATARACTTQLTKHGHKVAVAAVARATSYN